MFSAFNPSKCTHLEQWAADCAAPGEMRIVGIVPGGTAPGGIVKRKMRYARPNNAEELKATIRATLALITPEQCHRLIDSMPRRIAAVIQAKGAPTKY